VCYLTRTTRELTTPAEVQIADVGFLCYIIYKQAHASASGWRVDELLVLGLC
jgi:hypothetical protein